MACPGRGARPLRQVAADITPLAIIVLARFWTWLHAEATMGRDAEVVMGYGRAWASLAALLAVARVGAEPVAIAAGELAISLDPIDGYAVASLVHKPTGTELVAPRPAGAEQDRSLWQLHLRDADGQTRTVSAAGLPATCTMDNGALRIVWRGVGAALGADLAVTVTATPRTDDVAWRIAVEGSAPGVLWQVDFPRLLGLRGLGDDQLALPEYLGRLVRQPAGHAWRRLLVYPQPASMQFLAWWGSTTQREPELAAEEGRISETGWTPYRGDNVGLYCAAEDGRAYYKILGAQGGEVKGQFGCWLSHVPELETWPVPAGRLPIAYAQPYDVVTAGFTGDWHEAAERYERWASQQVWSARGTMDRWDDELPDQPDGRARFVPKWFRDIAFWGKFYYEPAKVLPELAAYRQWLQVPMASHWYRYTIAMFDDNYPEQLPADPYFREAVRMGRAINVPTLPYTNGSIWDTDTQSWLREDGFAAALKDEAGGIYPWDIHGDIFAWMCPATEAWRAKIRETSHKLITEHGCPGVYLDVLVAGTPRPCYDPAHGHPIRGGNHYGAGNRRLLYELRDAERRTDPEAAFFSEEIGELYNDLLDGHLTLDQLRSSPPPGEQVWPLFPAVYHPYTINFGSDSALEAPLDRLAWEMGQMLIWGSQPLHATNRPPLPKPGDPGAEFLRHLVQAYHQAGRPFLQGGRWTRLAVRPTGAPAAGAPLELAARPHRLAYEQPPRQKRLWSGPAVMASAWRRGGNLGLVMVNITGESQPVELSIAPERLGLAGARLRQTWPDLQDLGPAGQHRFSVPPREVRILVIGAGEPPARRELVPTPWEMVTTDSGPFPPVRGAAGSLWACADGPVGNSLAADATTATPLWLGDDGQLLPRSGRRIEQRGPAAEGRGLPRGTAEQPFLLLDRLPHTASAGSVTIWSGDAQHLLALAPGGAALRFAGDGLVVVRDTVRGVTVRGLEQPPAAALTLPAGGPYLVGYAALEALRPHLGLPGGVLEVAPLIEALRELTGGSAADRERALGAATEALDRLVQSVEPGLLIPPRPLAGLLAATQALASAEAGWRPVLRAEHDWLAPGVAKEVLLLAWRPGAAQAPQAMSIRPLGDWEKRSLTQASAEPRDLLESLPLRHRFQADVVERLAPVQAVATVDLGRRTCQLIDLLFLEANRPVEIRAQNQPLAAVTGRQARGGIVLRNSSPYELTERLSATGPGGWEVAIEPAEVKVPPLTDVTVAATVRVPEGTPRGRYELLVSAAHAEGANVVAMMPVSLQRSLVPATADGDWQPAEEKLARVRQSGGHAIYLAPGESLRATIRNVRVTIYNNSLKYSLVDPDLKSIKSGTVAVDESVDIEVPAATPGTWYLRVEPLSSSAVVAIANRSAGEIATAEEPLKLFNSALTRYFHVPAGSRGFRLGYRDGGPDETARIVITSPKGRVALTVEGNSRGTDYPVEVREGEADGIWTLRVEPRQDMMLWLAGEVTPYLSTDTARVLMER